MRSTQTLLNSTEGQWTLVGEPCRADGWYGYTDGRHTIAIYLNDFRGDVIIEASLANTPTEDDWFPIDLDGPVLHYPKNPLNPTGQLGDSGIEGYSFTANVLWIRARVTRPDPAPTDPEIIKHYGLVTKILLNG